MKKFFKILLILVLVLVLALAGLIGWLSATEYLPAPVETLAPLSDAATAGLPQGETLELLSWNIGYAGLGKGSDFVLDGGENMRAADKATVQRYLEGIEKTIADGNYDQTFTYTLPKTYPAYTESGASATKSTEAMPATSRIVAFVSNWSRSDDCEAYNVNSALIGHNAEDAAAITNLQPDASLSLPIVDLQGRRVSDGQHGFMIKNGRVIMLR